MALVDDMMKVMTKADTQMRKSEAYKELVKDEFAKLTQKKIVGSKYIMGDKDTGELFVEGQTVDIGTTERDIILGDFTAMTTGEQSTDSLF